MQIETALRGCTLAGAMRISEAQKAIQAYLFRGFILLRKDEDKEFLRVAKSSAKGFHSYLVQHV